MGLKTTFSEGDWFRGEQTVCFIRSYTFYAGYLLGRFRYTVRT